MLPAPITQTAALGIDCAPRLKPLAPQKAITATDVTSARDGPAGRHGMGAAAMVVPMLLVESARRRQRRAFGGAARRIQSIRETSTAMKKPPPMHRGSENVLELAKKANVKLEVRPWEMLTSIAKDAARGWFVKRAEEKGIPWNENVAAMRAAQPELDVLYDTIRDPAIQYPAYYTQPFHGYDQGNLNWLAAHELESATCSMCLSYYDGMSWQDAQEKYRRAARDAIVDHWLRTHAESTPQTLLDMGCSGGFSTNEMARAFPGVDATGIDLSPFYLSVASKTYPDIAFEHRLAEDTQYADGSFDVVTLNFLLHELPRKTSIAVLREAHRVLKPGGVLAVLDVDPRRLLELPPLRRWAFQVTEPWCKEGEYYSLGVGVELQAIGFQDVAMTSNDPVNAMWLATK